jgi:PAS domain S-box-containing protein
MSAGVRVPQSLGALFAALTLSPEPVFVTDRQNHIVCWNQGAAHLLGYSEEEAVGSPCAGLLEGCDVYDNRYCSETCPVTQMAARSETVRHFDLRLRAKDGSTVLVDVSILTFVPEAPDRFFLAHILRASDRSRAPAAADPGSSPPRDQLITVRHSADARARKLTAREVEVLGMLAAGRTTPEIAERLRISNLTARNHIQNILDKLEVHSKAEAVAFAFQKRLI